MVTKHLTDFAELRTKIVNLVALKNNPAFFNDRLHTSFKTQYQRAELSLVDCGDLIEAIENKIRQAEIIYCTYFDTTYDPLIILNASMTRPVQAEFAFVYGTSSFQTRLVVSDHKAYSDLIKANFQAFILLIASIHENIAKLVETLLKKITVHEGKSPYQSITITRLMKNWDNLVELGYKKNDIFYGVWLSNHRLFCNKYLNIINTLRNAFIHGYKPHFDTSFARLCVLNLDNTANGFQETNPRSLIGELILEVFVFEVLDNTRKMSEELLQMLARRLAHAKQKIPM